MSDVASILTCAITQAPQAAQTTAKQLAASCPGRQSIEWSEWLRNTQRLASELQVTVLTVANDKRALLNQNGKMKPIKNTVGSVARVLQATAATVAKWAMAKSSKSAAK